MVCVFDADLQHVFEQEAFPVQSAPTDVADEALHGGPGLPLLQLTVSDAKSRSASLSFRWRTLFGPVTVGVVFTGDGCATRREGRVVGGGGRGIAIDVFGFSLVLVCWVWGLGACLVQVH